MRRFKSGQSVLCPIIKKHCEAACPYFIGEIDIETGRPVNGSEFGCMQIDLMELQISDLKRRAGAAQKRGPRGREDTDNQ
jgi:hypothetical protein